MEITNLKNGDMILLVTEPPKGSAYTPEMQPYLGKTVTVTRVHERCVSIQEDCGRFAWTPMLIEKKV